MSESRELLKIYQHGLNYRFGLKKFLQQYSTMLVEPTTRSNEMTKRKKLLWAAEAALEGQAFSVLEFNKMYQLTDDMLQLPFGPEENARELRCLYLCFLAADEE